ncbi:MAG: hypothetical protein J6C30_05715 [Lentisphaeria bacterium]|nr:hypothetical protein [Lentisphaeria bacterium]
MRRRSHTASYKPSRYRKVQNGNSIESNAPSCQRSRLIFQVLFWTLTLIGLFFAIF